MFRCRILGGRRQFYLVALRPQAEYIYWRITVRAFPNQISTLRKNILLNPGLDVEIFAKTNSNPSTTTIPISKQVQAYACTKRFDFPVPFLSAWAHKFNSGAAGCGMSFSLRGSSSRLSSGRRKHSSRGWVFRRRRLTILASAPLGKNARVDGR